MKAADIQKELQKYVNAQKREFLPYFFKTGEGQ